MNCPVCTSVGPAPAIQHTQPSFKDELKATVAVYYSCPDCGLCFKEPPAKEADLKAYYTKAWQYTTPRPKACFETAASWINHVIAQDFTTAVDVGARDSELLKALKVEGDYFDPQISPNGWLGDRDVETKEYDLVCATHVLEHVVDPVGFLLRLRDMTKPMGHLYIEVPSLEIGAETAGVSDDINRNHLHHFSVPSLVTAVGRAGLHVLATDADEAVPNWPVVRILLCRYVPGSVWLQGMAANQKACYVEALKDLKASDPKTVGLYGASGTLVTLMQMDPETVGQFRVFDLYKHGKQIGGVKIEHPDKMTKEVYIVPRFWNSVQDISKALDRDYPTTIHLPLFKECVSNTQESR